MTAEEREQKKAEAEAAKRKAAEEAAAKEAQEQAAKEQAAKDAEAKRQADAEARKAAPVDADVAFSLPERMQRFNLEGEPRTVRACSINRRFFINTPEGKQSGDVGDWIVQFSDGRRVVVSHEAWQGKNPRAVDGLKRAQ